MSECSASVSTIVPDGNHQVALPDDCPPQHETPVDEENKIGDGNGNENVPDDDDDEDTDFNPFLKENNSIEASSNLSSEVEDLDLDVADSSRKVCAVFDKTSEGQYGDTSKDCNTGENVEHGEETMMQTAVPSGEVCGKNSDTYYAPTTEKNTVLITPPETGPLCEKENGPLCEKENGSTSLIDVSNGTDSRNPVVDIDSEGAICMRTRARYSLASFTLDELETFLQETDDEDDLQNVDDEEEYKKFLSAVLIGDDSLNLQGNANADDDDEENDADFELEIEEALESEPEEIEERRTTRRNRSQKSSLERSKKLSGHSNRQLRPLLPFASIGSLPAFGGKHLMSSIVPSYMPPVNNGFTCGLTPHQIGQLHCLIHEHVQLLIQVFSICVLEPGKSHIAAELKALVIEMLRKRDQVLGWRTVPYPGFCFFPPYIHPSVSDEGQKMLPCDRNKNGCSNKNRQLECPSGSNRELHSDIISLSNGTQKRLPTEQAGSSQTLESTSWRPYICGPVLSVMDVAPLRLVQNYIDDVSSAVQSYERYQIEHGFETLCQKEPLFPIQNGACSAESDVQGEIENTQAESSGVLSSPSGKQVEKKSMAVTLLEKAKNEPVALVPKEIASLAQRFWPLFNPSLYPHKPPLAALAYRVLFTDAEDELLALGLMEYNNEWKAIQQRFLPCKSRHQIFVRQKNRTSSKAPENAIKAVRKMKNSPLTSEEISRIEMGLKKFKLDWISIWRIFVPYRDPALLPRQWRIASGTQKSYKSDANKKAKRRLYALGRKTNKPSPSTQHSSSEKEGDSTDNVVEETNSGDNHRDKEDEAYVHEAFLADWRPPDNNVSSSFPARTSSHEGSQAREQRYGDTQPQIFSNPSAALRISNSQAVPRPYRARRPDTARMVKLAPDLPPVNLPPSVKVMSQSAFKSSQSIASTKVSGVASRIAGVVIENRPLHARSTMQSLVGSPIESGLRVNNPVNITVASRQPKNSDKCVAERGDSELQMHPLLFQAPQDGHLPYYPPTGKQPQLSLSLFHNPRHIRDAVNFLSKSSKPPGKNTSSSGADFHPLLQRTDSMGTNSTAIHRSATIAESRLQNPSPSTSKRPPNGISDTNVGSLSGRGGELDLDIHLNFTSKNKEVAGSKKTNRRGTGRSLSNPMSEKVQSESAKDCTKKRDSAVADGISNELNLGECPLVASRNKGSRKISDTMRDESVPDIIMEQEELSDSEEEFGENVEFECEEMDDSEGESTSDSEEIVNLPNEEVQLYDVDADINDARVQSDYGGNTCSTSGVDSRKGVNNNNSDVLSLNLNSWPPISPHSNSKNDVACGHEFGPFAQNQLAASSKECSRHVKSRTVHMQKRSKDADTLPRNMRKRVCRSNSN